jgi:hypothetical protein
MRASATPYITVAEGFIPVRNPLIFSFLTLTLPYHALLELIILTGRLLEALNSNTLERLLTTCSQGTIGEGADVLTDITDMHIL